MRRALGCVFPGVFQGVQGGGTGQAFGLQQRLQGVQPVVVVGVAQVGVALALGVGDGLAQGLRPLAPTEQAALVQRQGHGESLGLPGSAENRSGIVLWQAGKVAGGVGHGHAVPGDAGSR